MSQPKRYHWTTHQFWCDDCEAPRYASHEALDDDEVDGTPAETAASFIICLACSYGSEEWAKECLNPEGEIPQMEKRA